MKRVFKLLILLFGLYFIIQICFNFFGEGHNVKYTLENNGIQYYVEEIYTSNRGDESNNYYFNVTYDDKMFSFQTFKDFSKNSIIISDIYSYSNDQYSCILPVFKGEQLILDIMCNNGNAIIYYNNIKGLIKDIDAFAERMSQLVKYDSTKWSDLTDKATTKSGMVMYNDNLAKNYNIAVSSYKGVYIVDSRRENLLYSLSVFQKDIYDRKISGYVKDYYVVADYSELNYFKYIYVVNLKTYKVTTLQMPENATYNTYVMGSYKDSIYLFDRTKKVQYEVNTKEKNVTVLGSKSIVIYKDGSLQTDEIPTYDIKFSNYSSDYTEDGYDHIDKVGNKSSGYYYFYKKIGNSYEVYRANVQKPSYKTYLFKTSNMRQIYYIDDYVYFISGNKLMSYNDEAGLKTNLLYTEFDYNSTIYYTVYKH